MSGGSHVWDHIADHTSMDGEFPVGLVVVGMSWLGLEAINSIS